MKYHIYSFEKLEVYKEALQLSVKVRKLISLFPMAEKYGLISQIRRASDSITANLAEGSGRSSNMDQAHFTNIAYASGLEIISHFNLAFELKYISECDFEGIRVQLDKILNQLNALYKYQINNISNLKKKTKE